MIPACVGVIDLVFALVWLVLPCAAWLSQLLDVTRRIFAYGKLDTQKKEQPKRRSSALEDEKNEKAQTTCLQKLHRLYDRYAYTSHAFGFACYYVFGATVMLSVAIRLVTLLYYRTHGLNEEGVLSSGLFATVSNWVKAYHTSKALWNLQQCGFADTDPTRPSILPQSPSEMPLPNFTCLLSNYIIPNLDALLLLCMLTVHLCRRLLETIFVHKSTPTSSTDSSKQSAAKTATKNASRQHLFVTIAGLIYYLLVVLLPIQGSSLFAYPELPQRTAERLLSGKVDAIVIPTSNQTSATPTTLPAYPTLVPRRFVPYVNGDPALTFSSEFLTKKVNLPKDHILQTGKNPLPASPETKSRVERSASRGDIAPTDIEARAYAMGLPSPWLITKLASQLRVSGYAEDEGHLPLASTDGLLSSSLFYTSAFLFQAAVRLREITLFTIEYISWWVFSTTPWEVSRARAASIQSMRLRDVLGRFYTDPNFPRPQAQAVFEASHPLARIVAAKAPSLFIAKVGHPVDSQLARKWSATVSSFAQTPQTRLVVSATVARYILAIVVFLIGSFIQTQSHMILARLRAEPKSKPKRVSESASSVLVRDDGASQAAVSDSAIRMRVAHILAPSRRPLANKAKATALTPVQDDATKKSLEPGNEDSTMSRRTQNTGEAKSTSTDCARNSCGSDCGDIAAQLNQDHRPDWTVDLLPNREAHQRYKIPYGGLFYYVDCPHYLGEILIYFGFMIAMPGSLPGASLDDVAGLLLTALGVWSGHDFGVPAILREAGTLGLNLRTFIAVSTLFVASTTSLPALISSYTTLALAIMPSPTFICLVWVISNLTITARQTHVWYKQTFPDSYPEGRKAIIPFVL